MIVGPKICSGALTILYNLPVYGEGTAYVESAASHLRRLSLAHCLSIYRVLCVISRHDEERYEFPYVVDGYLANSGSDVSLGLCDRLAEATGNPTIKKLTLSFLRPHISASTKGLVRRKRAWCDECMISDLDSTGETYDRLIWSITSLKYCPIHNIELSISCWKCHSPQPILRSHLPLDRCFKCGSSLIEYRDKLSKSKHPRHHSDDMSISCVELMESHDLIEKANDEAAFGKFLEQVLEVNKVSYYQLAKRLQVSNATLQQWCRRRYRPRLDYFLDVCANLGVSASLVITDPILAAQIAIIPDRSFVKLRYVIDKGKFRKRDAAAIKSSMRKFLNSGEQAADTPVRDIAEQLHVNVGTLYFHCAEELAQIDKIRQKRKKIRRQQLENEATELVVREFRRRRAAGSAISQRAIVKAIRGKIDIPAHRLRKAYRDHLPSLVR